MLYADRERAVSPSGTDEEARFFLRLTLYLYGSLKNAVSEALETYAYLIFLNALEGLCLALSDNDNDEVTEDEGSEPHYIVEDEDDNGELDTHEILSEDEGDDEFVITVDTEDEIARPKRSSPLSINRNPDV